MSNTTLVTPERRAVAELKGHAGAPVRLRSNFTAIFGIDSSQFGFLNAPVERHAPLSEKRSKTKPHIRLAHRVSLLAGTVLGLVLGFQAVCAADPSSQWPATLTLSPSRVHVDIDKFHKEIDLPSFSIPVTRAYVSGPSVNFPITLHLQSDRDYLDYFSNQAAPISIMVRAQVKAFWESETVPWHTVANKLMVGAIPPGSKTWEGTSTFSARLPSVASRIRFTADAPWQGVSAELFAVVSPTGVLQPSVVPLAIIYEPPGNLQLVDGGNQQGCRCGANGG
jgi:hypothetical protein